MKIKACKQRNLTISTGEKNVGHYELYSADGINPAPVEVGSLSHHLQGFIHPRWFSRRISEPYCQYVNPASFPSDQFAKAAIHS